MRRSVLMSGLSFLSRALTRAAWERSLKSSCPVKIFICRDGARRSEVEVLDVELLRAGHMSYRFGQVSLSRTGGPEEKDVFALLDEAAGGQFAYDGCIDGRIE